MDDNDKALEVLNNQQLMNEAEWRSYTQPIRDMIDEIISKHAEAPNESVFTRKGSGGKLFDYVRDGYFEEILNEYFPDWSFMIPHPPSFIGQLVYVSGRLILNFKGVRRIFDDTGEDKMKAQDDGSMVPGAVKSATTDCFKRCCHRALGAAQNVYNIQDLERKVNVQKIRDVLTYIEDTLGEPDDAIPSEHWEKLQSAHDYFREKAENLPTEDKGWKKLNEILDKFYTLKETVDAERTRRD